MCALLRFRYGAHLSKEQVAELVAPHPDTLGLVTSWLEYSGVSSSISMTHGGGWLTVTGVPVSQANDLLGASYQLYRHTSTNKTVLRTVSYALPAALHAHVQTVVPTTYFSPRRTLQQTPLMRSREVTAAMAKAMSGEPVTVLSSRDDDKVRPEFLRRLYRTEAYVPAATDRNMLGVAGYSFLSPRQEDLTKFMSEYRTDAEDAAFKVVPVNGAEYDPSNPGMEANMNIQYTEGIAYPTPLTYYLIGGESEWLPNNEPSPDDADFAWLKYLLDQPNIPQTISISYGNDELGFPPQYTRSLCNLSHSSVRGASPSS